MYFLQLKYLSWEFLQLWCLCWESHITLTYLLCSAGSQRFSSCGVSVYYLIYFMLVLCSLINGQCNNNFIMSLLISLLDAYSFFFFLILFYEVKIIADVVVVGWIISTIGFDWDVNIKITIHLRIFTFLHCPLVLFFYIFKNNTLVGSSNWYHSSFWALLDEGICSSKFNNSDVYLKRLELRDWRRELKELRLAMPIFEEEEEEHIVEVGQALTWYQL